MRCFVFVVALVLAFALPAPAAAQILDDLGGRRAAQCADAVLEYLTGDSPPRFSPTFHTGLATWFMGCTYYLPPSTGPVLSTMQADIDTIYRHQAEEEDVSAAHQWAVCQAWWAIYSSTYNGLIPEFGSGIVGDLPTPDEREDDCERWVGR